MPPQNSTIIVDISVSADATPQFERYVNDASQTVRADFSLGVQAPDEASAIVQALKHAGDVAANRFGRSDLITAPPAVADAIDRLVDAGVNAETVASGHVLDIARSLASHYGMRLTIDAATGSTA